MKTDKSGSGYGINLVVVLIVMVAFILIYLLWLKDFNTFGQTLGDYSICKASNIENAKIRLKISNAVLAEREGWRVNKCRTEYIKIKKGAEMNTIAKKMAQCWDMYLEGKEELFETADNNYCAICSVMEFEDNKQLKGFTGYLIKNKAPGQGDRSYYQYLTKNVMTNDFLKQTENPEFIKLDSLDTSKRMAVIFTMSKNAYPGSFTESSSIFNFVVGSGGGAIAGYTILVGAGVCGPFALACGAGAFLIGAGIGTIGYMTGSSSNPELITEVLLWPYTNEDLSKLKCTMLEGKDTLEIRKS